MDQLLAEQSSSRPSNGSPARTSGPRLPPQARITGTCPARSPGPGRTIRLRGGPRRLHGLQGLCHGLPHLNGLEEDETWRSVGLLHRRQEAEPYPANRHDRLPSLRRAGLPERVPGPGLREGSRTGIVRHLDDQCIGCQYCILKCPYDVPQYSPSRGIVRKCDMCHSRLAADEAPACVQACPNEAIAIRVVSQGAIVRPRPGPGRLSAGRT